MVSLTVPIQLIIENLVTYCTCSYHPAHCFLFGFVQTAKQCHYGDEIDEIADASGQYTVDVKGDLIFQHQSSMLTQHINATNISGVFY